MFPSLWTCLHHHQTRSRSSLLHLPMKKSLKRPWHPSTVAAPCGTCKQAQNWIWNPTRSNRVSLECQERDPTLSKSRPRNLSSHQSPRCQDALPPTTISMDGMPSPCAWAHSRRPCSKAHRTPLSLTSRRRKTLCPLALSQLPQHPCRPSSIRPLVRSLLLACLAPYLHLQQLSCQSLIRSFLPPTTTTKCTTKEPSLSNLPIPHTHL